jgi:hypothetical protein
LGGGPLTNASEHPVAAAASVARTETTATFVTRLPTGGVI